MQLRRKGNLLLAGLFAMALIFGCAAKPNDAQLATNLKAQMFSDPQTKGADLQVAVKDGVATLSGSVPSDAAKLEAYKIATNTPGVTKVNDQMTVQSSSQTSQASQQTAQTTPPSASDESAAPAEAQPPAKSESARETKTERARKLREQRAERAERLKKEREQRAQQQAQAEAANDAASSQQPPANAAPPQPVNPPDASSQSAQTNQTQAQTQPQTQEPPPPPQPVDAVFPEGTTVEIQTIDPIDSKKAQAGDEFQATLAQPLTWNSRVIAPTGTNVYLRLVQAQTSGQYKGQSELQLELARLELNGGQYPMHSSTYTVAGGSRSKDTAKTVGGGAIVGAIIGAIAGGGKGAVIGGAAGAGAGGVYQGVTKAKQVRIPAETKLDFKLDKALKIPVASESGAQ